MFLLYLKGDDNLYLPHDASIANLTLIQNQISTRREEVLKKLANESTIYNGCTINLTTQIPTPANSPIEMNLQVSKQINLISLEMLLFYYDYHITKILLTCTLPMFTYFNRSNLGIEIPTISCVDRVLKFCSHA